MEKYIQQLLADLANAHHPPELSTAEQVDSIMAHFEEIDRWTEPHPVTTFFQVCDIDPDQFPAAEQLTRIQMETIIHGVEALLTSWNHIIDWPEQLSIEFRYQLLRELMADEAYYFSQGHIHHDFCTGWAPDCVLKEHCNCLQFWKEELSSNRQ
jgi:hypothetical protein